MRISAFSSSLRKRAAHARCHHAGDILAFSVLRNDLLYPLNILPCKAYI
jgi:hypothetical protein